MTIGFQCCSSFISKSEILFVWCMVDFDRLLIQRLPSSCYTPKMRPSKVQFLSTFKWMFLHIYVNSKMANTIEDRTLTFLPAGCWPTPNPTVGSSSVTPAFHSEIPTGVEIRLLKGSRPGLSCLRHHHLVFYGIPPHPWIKASWLLQLLVLIKGFLQGLEIHHKHHENFRKEQWELYGAP